jgi:hypothetical protein
MRSIFRLALAGLCAATLSAQASRTWISGVGDDANPGSRTAPCKTFAGAISKTAPGGEIDCLDPGGFGAITITKAITFDGGGGQVASILVAGTNGIVVQAAATDVVVIRNLRINGIAGSGNGGLKGINFISGKALIIENVNIDGFTQDGIYLKPTNAATVSISNTTINGPNGSYPASVGIWLDPSGSHVELDMNHVRLYNCPNIGFYAGSGDVSIQDMSSTGANFGVTISNTVNAQMVDSVISNNTTGIKANGGTLRVSNCSISGNGTGVTLSGGTVDSYGNNHLAGNMTNGAFSGTISQQ